MKQAKYRDRVVPWYPRSQNVQFHDILYTLSLDILYTSAQAQACAEALRRCLGKTMEVKDQRGCRSLHLNDEDLSLGTPALVVAST
jgi:hypothetical protein